MSIRPQHPESQVTSILTLHAKVVERIDRLRSAGFTIHEHLEAASRDLDELDRMTIGTGPNKRKIPCSILELVLQRTLDAAPGTPRAQNLDGGGGTLRTDPDGHPILRSDPTGDGATQGDIGARDRAELLHHLEAVNRHLTLYTEFPVEHAKQCRASAARLIAVVGNWTPRRADQAVKAKADTDEPPGCCSCERVGTWSPIHRTWRQGQLGEGIPLCGPCYKRALATGALPPKADVDRMARTGKMPHLRESA